MRKILTSQNMCCTRILRICFFLMFTLTSCSPKPTTPSGKLVDWEDVGDLYTRSYSNMDARKNDVELSVNVSEPDINLGDPVQITISLKNRTNKDMVIYSLNAMPVFGEENIFPYGIELILFSMDSGKRITTETYLDFPQFLPPTSQEFSVVPANSLQTLNLSLTNVFSLPMGNYSIQTIYKNESDFGAVVKNDSNSYFVDYDAWIGTISSNIESFKITP